MAKKFLKDSNGNFLKNSAGKFLYRDDTPSPIIVEGKVAEFNDGTTISEKLGNFASGTVTDKLVEF